MLYLRDVHSLVANGCRILQMTLKMFPDCKWIVVGGSPCQDLTLAGTMKGVLGLTGMSSRLFFILLCVIYTVQVEVGPAAVRFLVENAGSMQKMHLEAFCKLLSLPLMHQYWPTTDPRMIPNFCIECRDGQWTTNVWGYHCKQTSCHTCILQKMGQINFCPWHPNADEPPNDLALRACHFWCHKDPATSIVTVTGYTKLHSNSFTISIFHIASGESVAPLCGEFCRLHAPVDFLVSTLSESFISPEDLAHIAAPFRNDGFPNDLYRHFFLQVGGPIQSIEQWLQGWSPA